MPQAQATVTKQGQIEPLEPKAGLVEMMQVVENKKRNLEKRKQKLEALMAKPETLTEQQKEAITHFGEVVGNIQYVEEILVRFREIQLQVDKWTALEAKKEKLASKRNKQSNAQAKNDGSNVVQPVSNGNGHGSGPDVSAEVTPRSRGSICDATASIIEQQHVAEPEPTPSSADNAASNQPVGEVVKSAGEDVSSSAGTTIANNAALPGSGVDACEDSAAVDEEGATLKDTVTFVNSTADAGSAQANNEFRNVGRGPRGPRPHYDGPPRGGYGYGPRGYGGSGRRPYRGPRGPPRGGHMGANSRPQTAATSGAAN